MKIRLLSCAMALCLPAIVMAEAPVESRAYYSTNPDASVGQYATISIDGEFNDWNESMLISQGGANDQCNAFKGGHENCVLDMYSLYAAWDDDNLYIAWQMVNTADIWAREGDGPLSDGGRVLDVPLAITLSIDPSTVTMSCKNTSGGPIWGNKLGLSFPEHVDRILLMSGKQGLGDPAMFKAVDAAGNTNYADGMQLFRSAGIEYRMKEGFMPSHLHRQKTNADNVDVVYDLENYVDLLSDDYTGKKHNTTYDSFYEIKIPFTALGITREWLEDNGIGCRVIATRGESGIDCLPHDPTVLDNVFESYGADSSTSGEKDDDDVFTYALASIGKMRDGNFTPPTPPTPPTPDPDEDPYVIPTDGVYVYYHSTAQWNPVNFYVYDESVSPVVNNANWPGIAGTYVSDAHFAGKQGFWEYKLPENLVNGMVMFNSNGAQYPGSGQPGLKLNGKSVYCIDEGSLVEIPVSSGLSSAEVSKFSVSGLTVSGNGTVVLYNLQGREVASGQASATAPEAGLYIAVCDGRAVKVLLR